MWRSGGGRDGRPGDRATMMSISGSNLLEGLFLAPALTAPPRRNPRQRPGVPLADRLRGLRGRSRTKTVTCIACGESVPSEQAREYDKQGDRWDREDKRFEYLCKPCHGELNHQPRRELEGLLVEVDAGERTRDEFLEWYCALV